MFMCTLCVYDMVVVDDPTDQKLNTQRLYLMYQIALRMNRNSSRLKLHFTFRYTLLRIKFHLLVECSPATGKR